MTRTLFNVILLWWLVANAAAPTAAVWPYDKSPSISADELLARVTKRYKTMDDFRADVVVTTSSPYLGETSSSAGALYARQPNLVRVEFREPVQQTVVFDGEYMYVYAAGGTQVLRYAGPGLSYLADLPQTLDNLSTDYDVELVAETGGRTYELHLDAKREPAPFPEIRMWIDRERLVAVRVDYYDAARNCTSYRFSAYEFNPGLPASLFSFEVPPGVEIVDLNERHGP
ncbi:MAG: outer membrane lipoprotein carrier protein LolA [bacterium]